MAISINWATKVFTIPQADLTLVSGTLYEMDTEAVRQEINAIMDNADGMAFEDPILHNTEVTVAGTTFARTIEMINGYSIEFSPNSAWSVRFTGSNNNLFDVENGILVQNQVQVISNNSAGLIGSKQLLDQSYYEGLRVFIDTVNGTTGTAFPRGTPGMPVNNLADAQSIISLRGFPKKLFLRNILTTSASDDLDNYDIKGAGFKDLAKLSITAGASTDNLIVEDMEFDGTIKGPITAKGVSSIVGVTDFEGSLFNCGLQGTFTLSNTVSQTRIEFIKCFSQVAGSTTPLLDCNSLANLDLNVRGYHGGLEIRNFTLASMTASIDLDSGHLVLDSSNTNGTIVVRGVGHLTDNSAGATVIRTGLVEGVELDELWKLQGLDIDNPMTVTPTTRDAGSSVSQTISGDGTTTTTVTRDP